VRGCPGDLQEPATPPLANLGCRSAIGVVLMKDGRSPRRPNRVGSEGLELGPSAASGRIDSSCTRDVDVLGAMWCANRITNCADSKPPAMKPHQGSLLDSALR
jgi:hypothetical protein